MSFNFQTTYPNAPTAISPPAKDVQVKAVKLTNSDFTTGGTTSLKAVLPADASIIGFRLWVKTQLAGGGITAATLSIGVQGGSTTNYAPAQTAFGAANAVSLLTMRVS